MPRLVSRLVILTVLTGLSGASPLQARDFQDSQVMHMSCEECPILHGEVLSVPEVRGFMRRFQLDLPAVRPLQSDRANATLTAGPRGARARFLTNPSLAQPRPDRV